LLEWQPYFDNLNDGAILFDIQPRALHYGSADQSVYKLYSTSVPLTEDMTHKGRTSIIQKVEDPSWRPTPSMRERTHFNCRKHISVSTDRMTGARSGAGRRTVASVFAINTFPGFSG